MKATLKKIIVGSPVEIMARKLHAVASGYRFEDSSTYWEDRYKNKGNSGAGSYGRLAIFKADILNVYVEDNNISTVIEYGSGDGHQLTLANYPEYLGFDVAHTAIDICRDLFANNTTRTFAHYDDYNGEKADLTLSLDVIYHLVEDSVFEHYMARLFDSAIKHVIIYSSNSTDKDMLKGHGSEHVRHRCFTDWISQNRPDWQLTQEIPNPYPYSKDDHDNTSLADFFIFRKIQ
ncbi:methyltransferase domain-containing protein [Hellea balneolensis]|uniref:hypothetical protein n=1 Tax=Hellea balneolensis TaxID=287478 RepID=UPI000421222D|nr:hypothetical protein [Hellea balneolensis]